MPFNSGGLRGWGGIYGTSGCLSGCQCHLLGPRRGSPSPGCCRGLEGGARRKAHFQAGTCGVLPRPCQRPQPRPPQSPAHAARPQSCAWRPAGAQGARRRSHVAGATQCGGSPGCGSRSGRSHRRTTPTIGGHRRAEGWHHGAAPSHTHPSPG